MNEKDIVKEAMKTCGWSQETLAHMCGYKTQSAVSSRLQGSSMRVDTFAKLLSAMGYKIVIKSKSPNTNKNEWEVDC
jgi:ribosome-binding protein aMBF1 (putative translation factor)